MHNCIYPKTQGHWQFVVSLLQKGKQLWGILTRPISIPASRQDLFPISYAFNSDDKHHLGMPHVFILTSKYMNYLGIGWAKTYQLSVLGKNEHSNHTNH